MAIALEAVVKQLEDSGIVAPGKLKDFIPPKANPKTVEELVRELFKQNHLTKFQAQQVALGKAKALILGGYTLLDKIGAGGMGQVFKAQHRKMERLVAIKMLPPTMTKDAAALARFQREVVAAAKLRHPNIVAADDADEANGVHFLVMEYVEGTDLSALVKKHGPLEGSKALNYVLQTAKGLEFAHKKGVVHRDIKPANLLLDTEGTVKILDMGLARIEAAGDQATQAELTGTGAVMGTVDYMSPEQAFNTKHADARADIYSLGCTLYYLLAGKATFDGESVIEKILAHREKPIPSLSDVQEGVPDAVQSIFAKMVAKKVEDRYQTMTEVIADLEKAAAGQSSPNNLKPPAEITGTGLTKFFKELPSPTTLKSKPAETKQVAAAVVSAPTKANPKLILYGSIAGGVLSLIGIPFVLYLALSGGDKPPKEVAPTDSVATNPVAATIDLLPLIDAAKHVRNGEWKVENGVLVSPPGKFMSIELPVAPGGAYRFSMLVERVQMSGGFTVGLVVGGQNKRLTLEGYTERLSGLEPVANHRLDNPQYPTRYTAPVFHSGSQTQIEIEVAPNRVRATCDGIVVVDWSGIPQSVSSTDLVIFRTKPGTLWLGTYGSEFRIQKLTYTPIGTHIPPLAVAPFDAKQARAHQDAWATHLGTKVETTNSVGMKMVLIPPGEFMMGSTDEQVEAALKVATDQATKDRIEKSERPQHKVVITKPLLMSATEVTIGQFKKFSATGYQTEAEKAEIAAKAAPPVEAGQPLPKPIPNYFNHRPDLTDDSPAAYITWNDATAYCQWLSTQEKSTYRLPTEAEWEYACRAGTTTQYSFGDDYNELPKYGWHNKNAGSKSYPVGTLLPNPFGLFDMHGNLQEWCGDYYDEKGYAASPLNDPNGPSVGSTRVIRGGIWLSNASFCRSAYRYHYTPSSLTNYYGFRCVSVLEVPAAKASVTPQPTIPAAASGKLFIHDPVFQQWIKEVAALPADEQWKSVSQKLVELNPRFNGDLTNWDGKGTPAIENGVVAELGLRVGNVTDISPIRSLAGLKELALTDYLNGKNGFSDLSPLKGMGLNALHVDNTNVSNLSFLTGMPLARLYCSNTKVGDLSPLREMDLTLLYCANTSVADLTPLSGMKRLRILGVRGTQVTPEGVATLKMALPNCSIEWDAPNKRSIATWVLAQGGTVGIKNHVNTYVSVTDVSKLPTEKFFLINVFLSNLPSATDDWIAKLSPLAELRNLEVNNTPLGDTAMQQITARNTLLYVDLTGTKVTDASLVHLQSFPALLKVKLKNTQVTASGIAAFQKALPKCQVESGK